MNDVPDLWLFHKVHTYIITHMHIMHVTIFFFSSQTANYTHVYCIMFITLHNTINFLDVYVYCMRKPVT